MSKYLMLLLAIFCAVGCSYNTNLIAPAVDVIVEDARPGASDYAVGESSVFMTMMPLVPYFNNTDRYFLNYKFAPEISKAVEDSLVFSRVLDTDNTFQQRADAPLEMRVYVEYTRDIENVTSYGLGFVGFALHVVGFPMKYQRATATVRIECIRKSDLEICRGEGSNTDCDVCWIYNNGSSASERINIVVDKAVREALEECVSNMRSKNFLNKLR